VIRIPQLAPSASQAFSQSFEAMEGDSFQLTVYRGREPLEVRNTTSEARMRSVLELATAVYSETNLALQEHDFTREGARVTLLAPPGWTTLGDEDREQAAHTAFEHYRGLATLYGEKPGLRLSLRIEVEISGIAYEYDGATLRRGDD
jgi:hypothetical protein